MSKVKFLIPFLILFIFACGEKTEPGTGSLELNFSATYDGQPLATDGTMYDFEDGVKLRFEEIKFFVTEIELTNNDGATTSISEANLINLGGKTATTAVDGQSINLNNIEAGEYTSIKFYVGLSERLNNTAPSDLPATSELNDGIYWSDWESFIFSTIAGKADFDLDGTPEQGLTYHIGGNQSVRSKSFPGAIFIQEGETPKVDFSIDLKDVFMPNGVAFDIETFNIVHKNTDVMESLADNMTASLTRK